ncbi:hypothetical protein LPJ61_003990 [Coemansia biformis]|uniref:Uncharacterized protein n=1 Tax=Coemansia biformis TaxID=1286918 RepID=A0A9W7YAD3_9FUNG|nr:hypothetical protein LPJ61_003990 [Coemansia biformis]
MLKPFRIPETRLLAINELVAQVTLTYRTDEDEEMGYRYQQDRQLQLLVQTAVVSLVNCGYTNGVARGPGFVLHQMRKKWPIGRRYIFTRHGEPLQSSLHKYFFQLELVDDEHEDKPVLEITELRGVAQSVSSVAGSTIEGLEAVSLPPMAAIFGQGVPQESSTDRRRSGSGYSVRSVHSALSMHSTYSTHRPRSPFYYEAGRRPESPSPLRGIREAPAGDRTSRLGAYGTSANGGPADDRLADTHLGARADAQQGNGTLAALPAEYVGSPDPSTVRTRSISRSSVGSMQSVEQLVENSAPAGPAHGAAGNGERLGRTPWYRSLHGISPLSRQPKSLSSSDNEALLGAAAASVEATRIPRIAGPLSGVRPPPVPPASPGLSGIASRLRRKILSPISMPRQRPSESDKSREEHAGWRKAGTLRAVESRPEAVLYSAIPVPVTTPEKRKLEVEPQPTGIRRPDMPPPSKRPVPRPRPSPEEFPESVSIPKAVKNVLLRRLKSPLSRHADKSSARLSVRERIAAFNDLTVDSSESSQRQDSDATAQSTAVAQESPESVGGKAGALAGEREPGVAATRIPLFATPASAGRIRVGTATGFVSVAAGRPLSRTSTNNGRAASPALSQMSTVSARVQDAINALERASSGATPQPTASWSGTKRGANGPLEVLASPTKRPRAPSAADEARRNGASRLNPLNMVNRLVRRNTDR